MRYNTFGRAAGSKIGFMCCNVNVGDLINFLIELCMHAVKKL